LPGFVKGVFISDLFEEICTFYWSCRAIRWRIDSAGNQILIINDHSHPRVCSFSGSNSGYLLHIVFT
jgi:hypothetical protein